MTVSQVAIETLVPWKMVPVRTENCLRHFAHFQTRALAHGPLRPGGTGLPVAGLQVVRLVVTTVGADRDHRASGAPLGAGRRWPTSSTRLRISLRFNFTNPLCARSYGFVNPHIPG